MSSKLLKGVSPESLDNKRLFHDLRELTHEINNVLSRIIINSDLVLKAVAKGKDAEKFANIVKDSAMSAGQLYRDLLDCIKSTAKEMNEHIQLNATIDDIVSSLQKSIGMKRAFLDFYPASFSLSFHGDASRIREALFTLLLYICDFAEESDHIAVKTDRLTLDENDFLDGEGVKAGEYAYITISGIGFLSSKKDLERVFSQKEISKNGKKMGIDFGLSLVRSVVNEHNGFMRYGLTRKDGSEIKIFFPLKHKDQ